jgi:dihydrofolate reductase
MQTVAIVVMSLDGCLTRHNEDGTAFASPADQRFFRRALRTFDCAVMGGHAYRAAREPILANLTSRQLRVVLTREPDRHAADARPGRLEFRSGGAAAVTRQLAKRGYARCALVGGARTLTSCARARLLDELWVTLEPVGFGTGRRLFQGVVDFRFALIGTEPLGPGTVLLRYRQL